MSVTGRDNPLSRLIPAISSALTFGLLLGLVIVAIASPTPSTAEQTAATTAGPFDIELGDLYVKPAVINVPPNATFEVRLRNTGQQKHSLSVAGAESAVLDPGGSTTVTWGPFTRSVRAWCTVAGHKDSGMVLDVLVAGATGPVDGHAAADDRSADGTAKIDLAAKPKPDWKPFDPALEPAPGGEHHKITLTVKETEQEVAPGVSQLRWTFNGQVPGPVLRGKVGDLFTVTLINGGTLEHSIDLHASKVAPNVEMRPVKPGGKLSYQFQAKHAGIFYYHCGVNPMIHHIGNGMYGAVVIDPPDLPKVAKEYVLLQSELFTGPVGKPADLKKMHGERPDAVVFNGYVNQYLHRPIQVQPGERIRVWVFNVGPNRSSSFHVIGSIFDTVYKEGSYLLTPDDQQGGSQTLDLAAAQGGFVELTFDRAGGYPFVTHVMADAHRGAIGVFAVGDAK